MSKKYVILLFGIIAFLLNLQVLDVFATYWTNNSDFNNNGYRWLARTWQWNILGGYQSPSSGEGTGQDWAHFELVGSDWMVHLRADSDPAGWTVCAGTTQGWVWPGPTPPGIYQPTPLNMDPSISSLQLNTYINDMYGTGTGVENGVLSDVWFKAYDVVEGYPPGPYNYYDETVFGIDFYYRVYGLAPADGGFLNRLPDSFTYIKWRLGSGQRVSNIRATIIEASQNGPDFGIYFDPWNTILYEVEDVIEESISYIDARFRYLRVTYSYSLQSASDTDYPQLLVLENDNWVSEGPVKIDENEHLDVHVIKKGLKQNNGLYTIRIDGSEKTTYIDSLMLLAFNTTNTGFEVPITMASKGEGEVLTLLKSNDKAYVELKTGESLQINFRPKETQINQMKYVLILRGKQS